MRSFKFFKWIFAVWVLVAVLASLPFAVIGQNSPGVKVGDWVKYKVIRIGTDNFAWVPPFDEADWIKIEVNNISGTIVTVTETIHYSDGREEANTDSWDLADTDTLWRRFIIPINVGPGDKIGEYTIRVNGEFKDVDLVLNSTLTKTYGETTREVKMLKFNELVGFFEYHANSTLEYYWDSETGFLLERIWQTRYVEFGNTPRSTLILRVEDTNLWELKNQQTWSLLTHWVVLGCVGTATSLTLAAIIKREKLRHN